MPSYTYQCPDCTWQIDVSHGIHDAPKVVCQSCGGIAKKRLTSAPKIITRSIQETPSQSDTAHKSCEQSGCVLHQHPHTH